MKAHHILGSVVTAPWGVMTSLSMASSETAPGVLCWGFSPLFKRDVRNLMSIQQRPFEMSRPESHCGAEEAGLICREETKVQSELPAVV